MTARPAAPSISPVRTKRVPAPLEKPTETLEDRLREIVKPLLADSPSEHGAGVAIPQVIARKRRERAEQRIVDALVFRGSEEVPGAIREEVRSLVRKWAERGFEEGFPLASHFEIRCAEAHESIQAHQSGDPARILAAMEKQYRQQVIDRYGTIEIRGLQMSERVLQRLDLAYVPLHLEDSTRERVVKAGGGIELREIPRLPVPEILIQHGRVLIVGGPGSGKTTLVGYLAAQAAAGGLKTEPGWEKDPIPFVVPVRSLDLSRIVAKTIAQVAECEGTLLAHALDHRRALVLIDGIDEATHDSGAPLMASLEAFAKRHPGNLILATSRPSGLPDKGQKPLPSFATTRLLPMSREEVDEFIDKWCLAAEISVQKDEQRAREDARRAAEDLKDRVRTSRPVERLAETPLLCTILCVVHRFLGQRIPERRVALYEACTNVLLYEWDRAKFSETAFIGKLDAQAKRALLGDLAYEMHAAGVAELPASRVVERFEARLPALGRPADEAKHMVEEIRDRSGLLVERRPGHFSFSHLTFQEYLTALYCIHGGKYGELMVNVKDSWWHEVIVLACGIPGADGARLLKGLLDLDQAEMAVGTLLAAQGMEGAVEVPLSLRREIEKRLSRLIPVTSQKRIDKLVSFGDVAGPVLLQSLKTAPAQEKAGAVAALGGLMYEPACAAIARLMNEPGTSSFIIQMRDPPVLIPNGSSLASVAAYVLLMMAVDSPVAKAILRERLPFASPEAKGLISVWTRSSIGGKYSLFEKMSEIAREMLALIPDLATPPKPATSEKRRSKRAAGSA